MKTLWNKITKKNDCWEWTSYITQAGYGQVMYRSKLIYAHRLFYELLVDKIPKGMQLDHLCRNRKCVNPAHLEVVTPQENTLRGVGPASINAKKIVCLRGHELADSCVDKYGRRNCRQCNRARKQEYRLRQKGVAL